VSKGRIRQQLTKKSARRGGQEDNGINTKEIFRMGRIKQWLS
jgi:hypothetical protein